MDDDCLSLVARVIHYLDLARLHNEKVHVPFAHRKERLPIPEQLRFGMGAARQLTDLCFIEGGESDRQEVVCVHGSKLASSRRAAARASIVQLARYDVIDIAPHPALAWFEGANQWMPRRMEMFGGVLVLGRVAAPHVTARQTQAQVHPGVAEFETFFTALLGCASDLDLIEMRAGCRHIQSQG
jgi:hypothetical protein